LGNDHLGGDNEKFRISSHLVTSHSTLVENGSGHHIGHPAIGLC
jgi:hypothetical protein